MVAAADYYPVTVRLDERRTLLVELPARFVRFDRDGSMGYTIGGIRHLDRIRALAADVDDQPSPGHIAALRQGMGLTQKQFGEKIEVDKLTVSRWERGEVRPGPASIRRLRQLRRSAARKGVVICT